MAMISGEVGGAMSPAKSGCVAGLVVDRVVGIGAAKEVTGGRLIQRWESVLTIQVQSLAKARDEISNNSNVANNELSFQDWISRYAPAGCMNIVVNSLLDRVCLFAFATPASDTQVWS
jgi:hypothetical protein